MSTQALRKSASILLVSLLLVIGSFAAQETAAASTALDVQNEFIDTLIKTQTPVVIALANLGDVEGIVLDHDESVILLRRINRGFTQQLIFKNGVIGITPIQIGTDVLGY
jgi:sRNA-binding regulator protein Hfq